VLHGREAGRKNIFATAESGDLPMRPTSPLLGISIGLLIADPAYAHTGAGSLHSFASGFAHPFGGLDHLLAMFAVGLFAAQSGGRTIALVPGAFVAMMIAGASLGISGVEVPGVELAVALSVVAIALPVAFALGMPASLAMAYVGFLALFHGYAHGAELPAQAAAAPYVIGFAVATAAIHGFGVAAGLGIGRIEPLCRSRGLRTAGAVVALAGIGLAIG
jgi:urease accessory protein